MLPNFLQFSNRLNFGVSACCCVQERQIAVCKQVWTRFELACQSVKDLSYKYFSIFVCPQNLLATFEWRFDGSGCFWWASCWTWKTRALDQATLKLPSSVLGDLPVILADFSSNGSDSVRQTLTVTEGKCSHCSEYLSLCPSVRVQESTGWANLPTSSWQLGTFGVSPSGHSSCLLLPPAGNCVAPALVCSL